jgi:hypothetical protein
MARAQWFDAKSNQLLFDQYVTKMDSWQQATSDGVIEPSEIDRQAERVTQLLRALEPKLSDELHAQLTQALYELAVLYGMVQMSEAALLEKGGK